MKYLVGVNYILSYARDSFQDPEAKLGIKCSACGRQCDCDGDLI